MGTKVRFTTREKLDFRRDIREERADLTKEKTRINREINDLEAQLTPLRKRQKEIALRLEQLDKSDEILDDL